MISPRIFSLTTMSLATMWPILKWSSEIGVVLMMVDIMVEDSWVGHLFTPDQKHSTFLAKIYFHSGDWQWNWCWTNQEQNQHSELFFYFANIFESEYKVFLGFTFYPIEDQAILERFRARLCPFMKAIQKTTTSGIVINEHEIFDEIIRTAKSGQMTNQLSAEWYQFIQAPNNRTLDREHDNLVASNLK